MSNTKTRAMPRKVVIDMGKMTGPPPIDFTPSNIIVEYRVPPTSTIGEGFLAELRERATAGYAAIRTRICTGIPLNEVAMTAAALGLTREEMAKKLGTSVATLQRASKRTEKRLQPTLSDRMMRYERLLARTVELFDGDLEHARTWLHRQEPALDNQRPIDAAETEAGAREVEKIIMRLEHGVFT